MAARRWVVCSAVIACAVSMLVPAGADAVATTGTIAGTVIGPGDLAAAGVQVSAISFDVEGFGFDVTDPLGHYTMAALAPGDYFVDFWPPDSDLAYYSWPELVHVTAGHTTTIDVTLVEAGAIAGTVTDPDGGPVDDVEVMAENDAGGLGTYSDVTGHYAIEGVAPGEYTMTFTPPEGTGLVVHRPAAPVVVEAAVTTVVDAQLEVGGSIAGHVTVPPGSDSGVYVLASGPAGGGLAVVEPDGDYVIEALGSGDYYVAFAPGDQTIRPQLYDGATMPVDADPVHVESEQTTSGIDGNLEQCGSPFSDVGPHHVFCVPIEWLTSTGIASGYADGTYRPTKGVTRGAMAAFLWRRAGSPAGPFPAPGYSDVGMTHPFYTPIAWLTAQGIASGFADGTFRSGAVVSRQAAAAYLWRDAGMPEIGASPIGGCWFDDVCEGHPFFDAISWTLWNGIAYGYDDFTFRPTAPVSRQAIAGFLLRDEYRRQWEQVDGTTTSVHLAHVGTGAREQLSCSWLPAPERRAMRRTLCSPRADDAWPAGFSEMTRSGN